MSGFVPAEAAAVLDGSPVRGTVEEVNAIAGFARNVRDDCASYVWQMEQAGLSLERTRSVGTARIAAKVQQRLLPGAVLLHESATSAKQAFDAYASAVDQIHRRAERVLREVEEALGVIRSGSAEIERIGAEIGTFAEYPWNTGAPGTMPEPRLGGNAEALTAVECELAQQQLRNCYENQWFSAAMRWRSAIDAVETARSRWAVLIDERGEEETRLVAALADTAIGQLLSVSAAGPAARRFTVATAVSGELWGASEAAPGSTKSHPLLLGLLGSESAEHIWDAAPDPAAVTRWWAGLSGEDQAELIAVTPWVIGNLPGVPFAARDAANRNTLAYYRRYPQELSGARLELLGEIGRILKQERADIEKYGSGRPPVQLVALDLSDEVPKTAIGYGDLDTATHTTWQVPGMESDAHDALGGETGWDATSRNVYAAQQSMLRVSGGSSAVVAWLGYDTPARPPGDFGVLGVADARAGAVRFAAELEGAHAARSSGAGLPVTNVLAHSYGTTLATVALTLIDARHPVDSLVMLGSAGLDTERVPTYDVLRVQEASAGQRAIYTTHAAGDRLAPSGAGLAGRGQPNPDAAGVLGLQHHSPVYGGALSFSSEGDPGRGLLRTDGHSVMGAGAAPGVIGLSASEGHGYLDRRTESLLNVAKITTARVDVRLERSFVTTEAARVEYTTDPLSGLSLPRRIEGGR